MFCSKMSSLMRSSSGTVLTAYRKLKEEGIIDSVRGRGYFVIQELKEHRLVKEKYDEIKKKIYRELINMKFEGYAA